MSPSTPAAAGNVPTPDPGSRRTPKPATGKARTTRTPRSTAKSAAGSRSPGRRPGGPDTRGEIVRAARESFASKGFAATSMRAVAREAGVDAALVHHYFAGKDELFIEAIGLPIDPRQVAARVQEGPRDELGRRIVTTFLSVWESPEGQQRMKALLRSMAGHDEVARMMREGITRLIIKPVSKTLDVPDAEFRVTLVASQLMGLAMARYVVEVEPMASASVPDLIDRIAPTLQHYLTA
ncbi:TetR/AcrR family transcriptional regulator [Kribbella sp. CA-294648]|uniref:TetR/AcrR family transcriptional regulator n=1 Tax=Kribbella sp. CA-294648 TaxID=3239948 RepID=UPI003D945EBD